MKVRTIVSVRRQFKGNYQLWDLNIRLPRRRWWSGRCTEERGFGGVMREKTGLKMNTGESRFF